MAQIKFKRWMPVAASVIVQVCLGIAYIWSVFHTGISSALFNGKNELALLPYALLLAMLGVGGVIAGKLQNKFNSRIICVIGSIVLGIGFIAASFVTPKAPWLLWLTYGVLGGIGMGFVYSTSISVSQRWYPDKRGLITGIIVAALGMGGVIFTPIVKEFLIPAFTTEGVGASGELKTFLALGIMYLVVCGLCSLFIIAPPKDYKPDNWQPKLNPKISTIQYSTKETVSSYQFYLITIALLLACMGGVMVIGLASQIAAEKGIDAQTAYIGVMIISLFNSLGRLAWGWISDKLGRKPTIFILLAGNIVLSMVILLANGYFIFAFLALFGFFYGGFLSTFPALTADTFGTRHMTTNYGLVLLGFGVGAVIATYVGGYFKNIAVGDLWKMFPAFIISAAAALAAMALIYFVKPLKAKEKTEKIKEDK